MKDLIRPEMSEEEKDRAWEALKPDDTLISIDFPRWGSDYHFRSYKVVKRTPKGYIRLDSGDLLKDLSGYEIPTKELLEWIKKIQLEQEVCSLLHSFNSGNARTIKQKMTYEDAVQLKEMLTKLLK